MLHNHDYSLHKDRHQAQIYKEFPCWCCNIGVRMRQKIFDESLARHLNFPCRLKYLLSVKSYDCFKTCAPTQLQALYFISVCFSVNSFGCFKKCSITMYVASDFRFKRLFTFGWFKMCAPWWLYTCTLDTKVCLLLVYLKCALHGELQACLTVCTHACGFCIQRRRPVLEFTLNRSSKIGGLIDYTCNWKHGGIQALHMHMSTTLWCPVPRQRCLQ